MDLKATIIKFFSFKNFGLGELLALDHGYCLGTLT